MKQILNAALSLIIEERKAVEFDLEMIDVKMNIELLYKQINLCAIIHSSLDNLREELAVQQEGSTIDLPAKLIKMIRLFYSDRENRRKLDTVISKLPSQLQEEIFTEYLPEVEFPHPSILMEGDESFKVAQERVEQQPSFNFLPDSKRRCLLSRILIIIVNTARSNDNEWTQLKNYISESEESKQDPQSVLRKLTDNLIKLIENFNDDKSTPESVEEIIDEFFTIIEQVKEKLQSRHTLQSIVIYTMTIFWKALRNIDYQQAFNQQSVIQNFDNQIRDYDNCARKLMPEFMNTIVGKPTTNMSSKFEEMLLTYNENQVIKHYNRMKVCIQPIVRCLISAKKVMMWMQGKAFNNLSKDKAKKLTVMCFVGKDRRETKREDYGMQMYEELVTIIDLLGESNPLNNGMRKHLEPLKKYLAREGSLKASNIFIYDLCAKDGLLNSIVSFYAKSYNKCLEETCKLCGSDLPVNKQKARFTSLDTDSLLSFNEWQRESLYQCPGVFEDEQLFVDGILSILHDSRLQAKQIELDAVNSIPSNFEFSTQRDQDFVSLISRNPYHSRNSRNKLDENLIHQLPSKMSEVFKLEWALTELATSQEREKKWHSFTLRADSADRLHLALMFKKLSLVCETSRDKLRLLSTGKSKEWHGESEVVRRVAGLADIESDEQLWQLRLADIFPDLQDLSSLADVVLASDRLFHARKF